MDDTKLCTDVVTEENAGIMREDLREMFERSRDWQMLFTVKKCALTHLGIGNRKLKYNIGE